MSSLCWSEESSSCWRDTLLQSQDRVSAVGLGLIVIFIPSPPSRKAAPPAGGDAGGSQRPAAAQGRVQNARVTYVERIEHSLFRNRQADLAQAIHRLRLGV